MEKRNGSWDYKNMRHSERGKFNNCPYAYHLEREGWRKQSSVINFRADDRTFGQAVHEGLRVHYDGKEWPDIVKAYDAVYPEKKDYKAKCKDYQSGLMALENYRIYWSEQDKNWEILGTEVADLVSFNDEEHSLHIDLITRHRQTGEVWPWDHKCTEKQLGKGFWKKFELDSQVTRYTHFIKEKYGSCGGFIINGIQVGHRERMYKGEPAGYYQNFDRQPFSRNAHQIKYWMDSEADWQWQIEQCEKSGRWPKHLSALCGWCDFYELCLSSNNESVRDTLYTTEPLESEQSLNVIDESN